MPAYRISFFNENKILYINDLEDVKTIAPKECVLPIMIELSHELCSFLKIKFSNLSSESPLLNPIKGDKKLLCTNDYDSKCGYFLEYFIADNYEEVKHLKYININLFPLTEFKYWTDINFNKLKEFNKKEMEKEKNNDNNNDTNDNNNNNEIETNGTEIRNIYNKNMERLKNLDNIENKNYNTIESNDFTNDYINNNNNYKKYNEFNNYYSN